MRSAAISVMCKAEVLTRAVVGRRRKRGEREVEDGKGISTTMQNSPYLSVAYHENHPNSRSILFPCLPEPKRHLASVSATSDSTHRGDSAQWCRLATSAWNMGTPSAANRRSCQRMVMILALPARCSPVDVRRSNSRDEGQRSRVFVRHGKPHRLVRPAPLGLPDSGGGVAEACRARLLDDVGGLSGVCPEKACPSR